jgi:hypothetical protein
MNFVSVLVVCTLLSLIFYTYDADFSELSIQPDHFYV